MQTFDKDIRAEERELRDRFAMAALTGLCAANPPHETSSSISAAEKLAVASYKVADAMLAVRRGRR